jgi:hypothetical protein
MLFSDLYSEINPRFVAWLGATSQGSGVLAGSIALDYINRAQSSLEKEAPRGWTHLTKDHVELSLIPAAGGNPAGGSTGLEYSLPSDCGLPLVIYCDTTMSGKPTFYYNRNGKIMSGFRFDPNFDKASGFSSTLKFYYTPINTLYIRYQIVLSKLIGTGTEYLPFPGEIMLKLAMKMRSSEKGLLKEWQAQNADFQDQLESFKEQYQNPVSFVQPELNDGMGNPLIIPESNLATGTKQRQIWGRKNDMDVTRY